jgi:hypothetical protein
MLLAVDDEVSDAVAVQIRNNPNVLDVWVIRAAQHPTQRRSTFGCGPGPAMSWHPGSRC